MFSNLYSTNRTLKNSASNSSIQDTRFLLERIDQLAEWEK